LWISPYGGAVPAAAITEQQEPPAFVQLVANPLRWRVLGELARSDRTVRELTDRLDQPQNLVSYHLRRLRDGGLVHARRSSADGRDSYYALDLEQCEQQLAATAAALHPALGPPGPARRAAGAGRRSRLLFLCTGNSARSQMAAALAAHLSGGSVATASAGSHPKALHPNAVRVMAARGIDISGNRSTHVDELATRTFTHVITLCDRVREVCPTFPRRPELVHWSVPDPASAGATDRESLPAFERTAADLEVRIRFLLPTLTGAPATTTNPRARRSTHADR
jgi:protein-tyrosine-phosphatase/DNA-binding transcriptional ArsR family regulator